VELGAFGFGKNLKGGGKRFSRPVRKRSGRACCRNATVARGPQCSRATVCHVIYLTQCTDATQSAVKWLTLHIIVMYNRLEVISSVAEATVKRLGKVTTGSGRQQCKNATCQVCHFTAVQGGNSAQEQQEAWQCGMRVKHFSLPETARARQGTSRAVCQSGVWRGGCLTLAGRAGRCESYSAVKCAT
jgi:hypothetical protein